MNNNTLYSKYRPLNFDEVLGQDEIVITLKNQIKKNKIGHAYLFCGTRGTGKTSIAKIFARSVNCENGRDGNPCNICENCKNILNNANLNVFEIDAASNNGIDDVRRIISLIEYEPTDNYKYKVFIIDEAHALSNSASNALLKTLEEPPEYVIFILATTEPNNLPLTILSRCQRYDFKRIDKEIIVKNLKNICEKENIDIDEQGISYIAIKADGSMRDAISLLDRCSSYSNEHMSYEDILKILGYINKKEFSKLVKAINIQDVNNCLSIINNAKERGIEVLQFANDFVIYLRNLLVVKTISNEDIFLSISKEDFFDLKEISKNIGENTIIFFIEELSKAINQMKYDDNKQIVFEMTIIRLAKPTTYIDDIAILGRLEIVENILKNIKENKINYEDNIIEKNVNKDEKKTIEKIKLEKATYDEIVKIIDDFDDIIQNFDKIDKSILKYCMIEPANDKTSGVVNIVATSNIFYEQLLKTDIIKKLSVIMSDKYGKEILCKLVKKQKGILEMGIEETKKQHFEKIYDKLEMEIIEE